MPCYPRPVRLLLLLSFLPTLAHAQWAGYESLARTTALTAADDYRIGKGYVDITGWIWGREDDPGKIAPVDQIARRIVAASDRPDLVFNVLLSPNREVNAAALPGGFLVVNQGLIDAMPQDQLAFVIAHEIGHVILRHFATTMNVNQAMSILTVAEGEETQGDRAGAIEAQQKLAEMTTRYSRNLELEADLYGMLSALRAGFPVRSGIESMTTMKRLVGEVPAELASMSDHPTFSQRIAELEQGITTIGETHDLFDAGVDFARSGEPDAAVAAFQQFLTIFPHSSAAWSNLGTAYLQKALPTLPEDPWTDDLPLYTRSGMVVRAGADKVSLERARDAFARALAIDPNRDVALGNLGVLARWEGDWKGAEALLKKAATLDPKYPGYMNNLGTVAASRGDLKEAGRWFEKAKVEAANAPWLKCNRATLLERTKKVKDASALWKDLESSPKFALRAHQHLIALGAKPKDAPLPAAAQPPKERMDVGLIGMLGGLGGGEEGGILGGVIGGGNSDGTGLGQPAAAGAEGADRSAGGLKLGMSETELISVLGKPVEESRVSEEYYAWLCWPEKGFTAVLVDDAATDFSVVSPSRMKSGRGVGVGDRQPSVEQAYGGADGYYEDEEGRVLSYDSIGHTFYLDSEGLVVSYSLWE